MAADPPLSVLAGQKEILERILAGDPLPTVLEALVGLIDASAEDGTVGSVLLVDRDGLHLRHGAAPGLPADYVAAIDGLRIGPRAGSCGTAAHRREQVIVEDIETDPLWEDFRPLAASAGLRACWSTPIVAGDGRLLGTFAVYYRRPARPSDADLELIDLLVRTAALAITHGYAGEEREQALAEERRASAALARAHADLNFVLETTTRVVASLDREDTLRLLAEMAVPRMADICLIDLAERGEIRRAAAAARQDLPGASAAALERFAPAAGGEHPAAGVLASGRPEFAPEMTEEFLRATCRDEEHYQAVRQLGFESYMSVPLAARGRVFGALTLVSAGSGRHYREADVAVAQDLAGRVALAIDNIRLYQSARDAERRLALVARAGVALTSSLDIDTVVARLGELLVDEVAEVCQVYVKRAGGQWWRRTFCAGLEDTLAAVERLPAQVEEALEQRRGITLGEECQVLFSPPAAAAPWGSAAILPLLAHGDTVGVIALGTRSDGEARVSADVIGVLAGRAALAIDNAVLFEQERTAAEVLQRSLLPERLPEVPGLVTAARYRPAGSRNEVGGDWYDVLPLADGRVGIVMGDVMGRGIPAASVMGQLRNGLRMLAVQEVGPARALSLLNRMIAADADSPLATAVYGIIDGPRRSVTVANAGHCPPLVAGRGAPTYLDAPPGVPLGAFAGSEYSEVELSLEDGDLVLLYTDGLIEHRDRSLDEGLDSLLAAAGACRGEQAERVCDHLLAVLRAADADEDDTAILAVRVAGSA